MRNCHKTGKKTFATRFETQLAMANVQGKHARRHRQRFSEEPTRAYKCEFCPGWHMTSQGKGRAQD